jgi:hypothetical protein
LLNYSIYFFPTIYSLENKIYKYLVTITPSESPTMYSMAESSKSNSK